MSATSSARRKLLASEARLNQAEEQIVLAEGDSEQDFHRKLLTVITQNPEVPLLVAGELAGVLDDLNFLPAARHAMAQGFVRSLRDTLETVSFLAATGFAEAAWFRARDAVTGLNLYLEALDAAQQPVNLRQA